MEPTKNPPLPFIDPTEKIARSIGSYDTPLALSCRTDTASHFKNKKELMAIVQVTEWPIPFISSPCQSFNRLGMVDPKVSIDAWHTPAGILRVKEITAEFGIFDIPYRGRFHDVFRMCLDKVKSDCIIDGACNLSVLDAQTNRKCRLTPKCFGSG